MGVKEPRIRMVSLHTPTSSHASLTAVWAVLGSSGSTAPPGRLICPLWSATLSVRRVNTKQSSPVFSDGKRRISTPLFLGVDCGVGGFNDPGRGAMRSWALTPGKGLCKASSIISAVNSSMGYSLIIYKYLAGIKNIVRIKNPFNIFHCFNHFGGKLHTNVWRLCCSDTMLSRKGTAKAYGF